MIEAELESIKNIFSKGFTENCSREIFLIDSVLLTTPWTYEKYLNGGKTMESFYEKQLLLSKL